MSALAWLELALVVVLGTAGQLALKIGLRTPTSGRRGLAALLSPAMAAWLASYAATTILWLIALRSVPLSQAFPILGLQFALIPLFSARLLGEHITPAQWAGIVTIVLGVALVGQS